MHKFVRGARPGPRKKSHHCLEQGNLFRGIDNWSAAARSVVQVTKGVYNMAIGVVEFSNGVYKIRKIFA